MAFVINIKTIAFCNPCQFSQSLSTVNPHADHKKIIDELKRLGLDPILRKISDAEYMTDEQNYIVDLDMSGHKNPQELNSTLLEIPGVVETGLFINYVNVLIVGKEDKVEVMKVNRD